MGQGGEECSADALPRYDEPASRRDPRLPGPGPMGKRRTAGRAARRRRLAGHGPARLWPGEGDRGRGTEDRGADPIAAGGPCAVASPHPEKAALKEASCEASPAGTESRAGTERSPVTSHQSPVTSACGAARDGAAARAEQHRRIRAVAQTAAGVRTDEPTRRVAAAVGGLMYPTAAARLVSARQRPPSVAKVRANAVRSSAARNGRWERSRAAPRRAAWPRCRRAGRPPSRPGCAR